MNLKKIFATGLTLAASLCSGVSIQLEACVEPWNEISVSGGWRRDELKNTIHSTEIQNGKRVTFLKDKLKIKDIDIWQVGGKLHWNIPNISCWCEDGCSWLDRFYIRAYYYHGWVTDGDYREKILERSETLRTHASIHDGETDDYSIALGFLFPICDNFAIGPVGGWAYDRIKTKNGHAKTNGQRDPLIEGVKFKSTWEGPWVGFDFTYNGCLCN